MATFSNQELKSLWADLVQATNYLTGASLDDDAGLRDIHTALLSYFGLDRYNTPKTPGDYLRGISVMASYHYTGNFDSESAPLSLAQMVNYLSNKSACDHSSTTYIYRYLNATSHEVIEVCAYCDVELETTSADHYDHSAPDCICGASPCAKWHSECGPECSGRYYMTQADADNCDYCGGSNQCDHANASLEYGPDNMGDYHEFRYYCVDCNTYFTRNETHSYDADGYCECGASSGYRCDCPTCGGAQCNNWVYTEGTTCTWCQENCSESCDHEYIPSPNPDETTHNYHCINCGNDGLQYQSCKAGSDGYCVCGRLMGYRCDYPGCENICNSSTDWDGTERYYCCEDHYNYYCDSHGVYYDQDSCPECAASITCSYPGCGNVSGLESTDWDGTVRYYCCDAHFNQYCSEHGIYYGPEGTSCPGCNRPTNPISVSLNTNYTASYISGGDYEQWVWYKFTPTVSTTYEVTGTDNGDADIRIWTYQPSGPDEMGGAIYTNSESNGFPDFTIDLEAGTTYWICVKQYSDGWEDTWSITMAGDSDDLCEKCGNGSPDFTCMECGERICVDCVSNDGNYCTSCRCYWCSQNAPHATCPSCDKPVCDACLSEDGRYCYQCANGDVEEYFCPTCSGPYSNVADAFNCHKCSVCGQNPCECTGDKCPSCGYNTVVDVYPSRYCTRSECDYVDNYGA